VIRQHGGEQYKKLQRDEVIEHGAMHTIDDGMMHPVLNEETIGMKPADFSEERDFWNLMEDINVQY
jgi:hypothetical protein